MKISRYITVALSALLLAGCSSESDDMTNVTNEIQFSANLSGISRLDALRGFENGDKLGMYVTKYDGEVEPSLQFTGNYANNVLAEYTAAGLTCTPKIYWPESGDTLDVYAYYPYGTPTSVDEYEFKVATDQSVQGTADVPGGYENSDFLFASAKGLTKADVVPLTFRHCMSKFRINLIKGTEFEGNLPDDIIVKIHNTIPAAVVNLSTGNAVTKDNAKPETIVANKISNERYEAIIVPQRIESKLPLVEIITKGVSYLVESRFVFKAGIEHVYDITINGNPEQVKIEIGGEIQNNMN